MSPKRILATPERAILSAAVGVNPHAIGAIDGRLRAHAISRFGIALIRGPNSYSFMK
jgi:hypothetical protein